MYHHMLKREMRKLKELQIPVMSIWRLIQRGLKSIPFLVAGQAWNYFLFAEMYTPNDAHFTRSKYPESVCIQHSFGRMGTFFLFKNNFSWVKYILLSSDMTIANHHCSENIEQQVCPCFFDCFKCSLPAVPGCNTCCSLYTRICLEWNWISFYSRIFFFSFIFRAPIPGEIPENPANMIGFNEDEMFTCTPISPETEAGISPSDMARKKNYHFVDHPTVKVNSRDRRHALNEGGIAPASPGTQFLVYHSHRTLLTHSRLWHFCNLFLYYFYYHQNLLKQNSSCNFILQ